jgi:GNAT superfamily N-acetyltransferase
LNKEADKTKIQYLSGGKEMLDSIAPLWKGLNEHHCRLAMVFKPYYKSMTFEKRKSVLLAKTQDGELHVFAALDEACGRPVGYCICSLDKFKVGKIESFFVDAEYRGCGIGDGLIRKALAWMDEKGAVTKIVEVSVGNEQAFGFYANYGFYPRKTMLEQVRKH